jgi:hypothetical protein
MVLLDGATLAAAMVHAVHAARAHDGRDPALFDVGGPKRPRTRPNDPFVGSPLSTRQMRSRIVPMLLLLSLLWSAPAHAAVGFDPIVFVYMGALLLFGALWAGALLWSIVSRSRRSWRALVITSGFAACAALVFIRALGDASHFPAIFLVAAILAALGVMLILSRLEPDEREWQPAPILLWAWPLAFSALALAGYCALLTVDPAVRVGLHWFGVLLAFSGWYVGGCLLARAKRLGSQRLVLAASLLAAGLTTAELGGAPGIASVTDLLLDPVADSIASLSHARVGQELCAASLWDDVSHWKCDVEPTGLRVEENGGILIFGDFRRDHPGSSSEVLFKATRFTPDGKIDSAFALKSRCLEDVTDDKKRAATKSSGDLLIPDLGGTVRLHADGTFAWEEDSGGKRLLHSPQAALPGGGSLKIENGALIRRKPDRGLDAEFGQTFRRELAKVDEHGALVKGVQSFSDGAFMVFVKSQDEGGFLRFPRFHADGTWDSKFAYDRVLSYFQGANLWEILPNDQILILEDRALDQLNPDGHYNDEFDKNWKKVIGDPLANVLRTLATGPDGKIYVVIDGEKGLYVARILPNGTLDRVIVPPRHR